MKYVKQKSDTLNEPHWAILEFDSIWIPGDERSRTAPGHGYPEHSENVVKYIVFTDENEWKDEIEHRMTATTYSSRENFIAARVIPASIKTSVKVSVS
jgi:hypothetical protein